MRVQRCIGTYCCFCGTFRLASVFALHVFSVALQNSHACIGHVGPRADRLRELLVDEPDEKVEVALLVLEALSAPAQCLKKAFLEMCTECAGDERIYFEALARVQRERDVAGLRGEGYD